MKHGIAVTILILMVFAAGCGQARQVKVTYKSSPPGGTLYNLNGDVWGPCPKALWYDLDKEAIANGYLEAKGLVMRWPSGPDKSSGDLIRIKVDGSNRQVTFNQPATADAGKTPGE